MEAFTVGGTKPIVGPALLVGRRKEFSEHAAARTSLDVVRSMIRWTLIEMKIETARPSKVRVVGDQDNRLSGNAVYSVGT
jgi:hypothetical protein